MTSLIARRIVAWPVLAILCPFAVLFQVVGALIENGINSMARWASLCVIAAIALLASPSLADEPRGGLLDGTLGKKIQANIDAAFAAGGGTVWIPRGVTVLNTPLRTKSRVRLLGQGRMQSTLKLAAGVTADCVVGTEGFADAQTKNLWNYSAGKVTGGQKVYSEADGLHMGCVVEKLTIDGNRRGGAKAGGLHIYGGGFTVEDVGIVDCDGNGLWTECGRPGNSWAGDAEYRYANMYESIIDKVSVCDVTGHGVLFRGPNDSYMDRVQVKIAGGTGVLIDVGSSFETGGLKIGTLHAYSTKGPTINIRASYVTADCLYCDTPGEEGLVLAGNAIVADKAVIINHNQKRDKESWGVNLSGSNNFIGYLRYTNSQTDPNGTLHGGALKTFGTGNRVPSGLLYGGGAAVKVKGVPVSGDGLTYTGSASGW